MVTHSESYSTYMRECWNHFIQRDDSYDYSKIRPEILDSWSRSRDYTINPLEIAQVRLSPEEMRIRLNACMPILEIVRPYMQQVYDIVKGTDVYISFSDKDAYVLELIGDPSMSARSQKLSQFILGANRSESMAGTNAIGTSIYLRKPIQIWSEEHYLLSHKEYVCSGSPILDENNNVLGCINITGRASDIHAHTLGMVMCAAKGIANELKLHTAYTDIERISSQRNSIIQSINSGVILLGPMGRIIQINNDALRMLKLNYEDVIGKMLFDFISLGSASSLGQISDDLEYIKRKKTNVEVNIFHKKENESPTKFTISTRPVEHSSGITDGVILTLNEQHSIHKLVNQVSGFRAKYTFDSIIGESAEIKKMISTGKHASLTESNVLILGESGTGKELIAQAIHNNSSRAKGPFVAVNCASLPHDLVESELFGYERGAFTGASKEGRPGKFELADGGTIFLDEIGDMTMDAQSSLLRVLQMREVTRIGGKYPKPIDVHVIAATNQNLSANIENHTFRQDLFYRLNVMTINVPPLRERLGDIAILAQHFLDRCSRGRSLTFSPETKEFMEKYNWPGNIRQLENTMERAANLADGTTIELNHLPKDILKELEKHPEVFLSRDSSCVPAAKKNEPLDSSDFCVSYEEDEKQVLIRALMKCRGNVTKAGDLLEMSRRTMYRRLKEYDIDPTRFRRNGYRQ